MKRWPPLLLQQLIFFLCCLYDFSCHSLMDVKDKEGGFIPKISPDSAPQPFVPFLAPTPLVPFTNNSIPNLSGLCAFNFSSMSNVIATTTFDCWATFGPFLADVICCPQFEATLTILIGQFSRDTEMLALDATHANHCLSDLEQILRSQGANNNLRNICSIQPQNLTAASCPVSDVNWFESLVDSSKVLASCKKVDAVNECCTQICQNAIFDAASKLALKAGISPSIGGRHPEQSMVIDDCRHIVLRWLAGRLDFITSNDVLRRISNCKVNKVCPLAFPDTKSVARACGTEDWNQTACCDSMDNYISHLQKQSFITNLQAVNCAASLGMQLQKMNVSRNVYMLCQITLKHFSVQVGSQESGCLLPSLPSDVILDHTSGISFTCDLNDNIAAPWPSFQLPTSSCNYKNNNTVTLPELPAATAAKSGIYGQGKELIVLSALTVVFSLLV